jgi:hypothetical protein
MWLKRNGPFGESRRADDVSFAIFRMDGDRRELIRKRTRRDSECLWIGRCHRRHQPLAGASLPFELNPVSVIGASAASGLVPRHGIRRRIDRHDAPLALIILSFVDSTLACTKLAERTSLQKAFRRYLSCRRRR